MATSGLTPPETDIFAGYNPQFFTGLSDQYLSGGIDYMGNRSSSNMPSDRITLTDGTIFSNNPTKSGLSGLFGDGDGFLGSDVATKDLGLAFGGLQTLGNLWGGYKSLNLANKQFDFSKMIAERNLANSTQSYNTALADKINSRAESEMSTAAKEAYLAKNSLR